MANGFVIPETASKDDSVIDNNNNNNNHIITRNILARELPRQVVYF